MQLFFTNLRIASTCLGRDDYEIDIVNYAVENMEPAIRKVLEGMTNDQMKNRARD